jgi:catechol 2,3-dioxygenase-like lactoylglutathione lyase family enzyme
MLQFYTQVMGMKKDHKGRMKHGGVFLYLKSPGKTRRIPMVSTGRGLELNYYPPGSKFYEKYRAGSELDHIGFWVRDVDKAYEKLIHNGARGAVEPFSEGRYRLAFVKDPESNWIELIGFTRRRKNKKMTA